MNVLTVFIVLLSAVVGFSFRPSALRSARKSSLSMNMLVPGHESGFLHTASQFLADTSIGEEDVLAITGTTSDLPDPIYAVSIAAFLLIGTGILQFTLGDLNKEEGQARVRDFLATRRDTERKRGYFD